MGTKLKGLWEKAKDLFKKTSKTVRILLGVALGVVLLAVIAAIAIRSNRPYAVLFTGMSNAEMSSAVSHLEENGVTNYRVQGDSILVPADQESRLKAQMILAGYPNEGYLYDTYFENVNELTTSSERDTTLRIATQERLESVIRWFEGVRDVSVNITPGKDQTYVLDDSNQINASASVVVTLDGNDRLSDQVADAIRTSVARAVQGLNFGDVSITDNLGNTYSTLDGISSLTEASQLKLRYEEQINNKVRVQVLQALGSIYGQDNVDVAVNSVADVNRQVIEATEYAQPEGSVDGGGLIGNDTWFWQVIQDEEVAVGGIVGTTSNSDIPLYPEDELQVDGDETYVGHSGEREHEIDTTKRQIEVLAGEITDLSVAVTINEDSINAYAVDSDVLVSHVAAAAGINMEDPGAKISVVIAPFYEEVPIPVVPFIEIPEEYVPYLLIAAAALLVLLILLIIILSAGRKRKKRKLAEQQAQIEAANLAEAQAIAAAVATNAGADIMEMNMEKSMELRKEVRQFAQNNPEIAAQIVKNWLKGDEDNG